MVKMEIFGEPHKHFESELYKRDHNLADFYIKNSFHQCRLAILADQISQIVKKSAKKMTMLNIGCGSGELESRLMGLTNLFKIGIDVSEEAINTGVKIGVIDRAIVADIEVTSFEEIKLLEPVDIVVMAEVLEHLQHPGVFIKEKISSLQKDGGYFLGSVPNMSQFHDVIGLFSGRGYSYQTYRPLMDSTSGHISFFSLRSLRDILLYGGYDQIRILGNGVRILRKGDFSFEFLSKVSFLKQFSDRFIFCCRKKIKCESKRT